MSDGLETVRGWLDDALVCLPRIDDDALDLHAIEGSLGGALQHVYAALAAGPSEDWDANLRAASALVRRALGDLQHAPSEDAVAAECLGLASQALRGLVAGISPYVSTRLELPQLAADARAPATVGVPALVVTRREVLRPGVSLPPPDDADEAGDEAPPDDPPPADLATLQAETRARLAALDAEPDDAPAPELPARPVTDVVADEAVPASLFGAAVPYHALMVDRAQRCLEDLAAFGRMRRPTDDESWFAPRTEARLLARVDALVACGAPVFSSLVASLGERPVPDPELTWALTFLFGCLAGDDALDAAFRVARSADLAADAMADSVADALSLIPSRPGVEARLAPWCDATDPRRREVAVTALARRGALDLAQLTAALRDDDPDVVRAAARALWRYDAALPAAWWQYALHHTDNAVVTPALRAALWRRQGDGLARAKSLVRGGSPDVADAAVIVALASGDEGLAVLRESAARAITPGVVEALGWFGHVGGIEVLCAALRAKDDAVTVAAAEALWRITGAALGDDDDPDDEDRESPSVHAAFRAPVRAAELTRDADLWSRWLSHPSRRMDPSRRWRFGHPWSPADNLWELEDTESRPRARTLASIELAARTGVTAPLDLEQFLARQGAQLRGWRQWIEGRPERAPAGTWRTQVFDGEGVSS